MFVVKLYPDDSSRRRLVPSQTRPVDSSPTGLPGTGAVRGQGGGVMMTVTLEIIMIETKFKKHIIVDILRIRFRFSIYLFSFFVVVVLCDMTTLDLCLYLCCTFKRLWPWLMSTA